jgi:hypothetical protein
VDISGDEIESISRHTVQRVFRKIQETFGVIDWADSGGFKGCTQEEIKILIGIWMKRCDEIMDK